MPFRSVRFVLTEFMRVARRRLSSRPPGSFGAEHSQGSGTRTKFRGKSILVVDDLEDNRELFATVLRGEGYVVTTAADGVEAIEAAERERPDVILMDLGMPRMDGFDAIARLRMNDHGRAAFIIVVSAFCDRASRARAEQVGADAFVGKPCTPRDLLDAIEQAFTGIDPPRAAAG